MDWKIPEHWKIVKIKLLLKVKDGTHDTPTFIDEGEGTVPLITSKILLMEKLIF